MSGPTDYGRRFLSSKEISAQEYARLGKMRGSVLHTPQNHKSRGRISI